MFSEPAYSTKMANDMKYRSHCVAETTSMWQVFNKMKGKLLLDSKRFEFVVRLAFRKRTLSLSKLNKGYKNFQITNIVSGKV
jgi:hypothetical protein